MTIDAVVFDIGNVLIEWQPERHYDATIGRDRREALFRAVDLHGINDRIDHGDDFRGTIYGAAEAQPEWAPEIRMWHDDWLHLAGPEIPRSVRLLRALRAARVPVFALSNFGVGTFAIAEERWPFLAEFDRRFISGHMRMAKPAHEIYAEAERETGLDPARLLFADDRADNIATARARGWQTHLFEGPDGWADRLVAEGLLTEAAAR